ncbi:hypothetical protein U2F26_20440 [Micromonospora sp. 4G57]|nr:MULTISPECIES: hypothetical protein [unclassified Micromonospora]MDZ5445084.1 hypothetical protein [Micromonospora sp. 4G57]
MTSDELWQAHAETHPDVPWWLCPESSTSPPSTSYATCSPPPCGLIPSSTSTSPS